MANEFDEIQKSLQLVVLQIREMNKAYAETLSINKDLSKEIDKGEKQTESFIRKYSQVAATKGPYPTFARGWTALRRFSSRLAPEFWAIQNATVGFLDSVQTGIKIYDKFGEKRKEIDEAASAAGKIHENLELSKLETLKQEKELLEANRKTAQEEHEERLKSNREMMKFLDDKAKYVSGKNDPFGRIQQGGKLTFEEQRFRDELAKENQLIGPAQKRKDDEAELKIKELEARIEKEQFDSDEREKESKKLKNRISRVILPKKVTSVFDGYKKIFEKFQPAKIAEMLKNVGRMAKGIVKFMGMLFLVVTALYLLHQRVDLGAVFMAIFTVLKNVFIEIKRVFRDDIIPAITNIVNGVMMVISAIDDILGGDSEGFMNLIRALKILVIDGLGQLLKGAGALIIGVLIGFVTGVWEGVKGYLASAEERGINGLTALLNLVTAVIAIVAAIGFIASGLWIPAAAVLLAGAIAAAIQQVVLGGLQTGGTATARGMYLVGERGPELVGLPANSRVYNNRESMSMTGATNNITVNVQGRVGASDAELRDIAQRIGRMVNMEVNRSTASRTRGV